MKTPAIQAAGAILDYLLETQRSSLDHFEALVPYRVGRYLEIDESTRRSLEITRTTARRPPRRFAVGSDRSQYDTAMGSRLLGDWVAAPLTNRDDDRTRGSMPWRNCYRTADCGRPCRTTSKGSTTSSDCWLEWPRAGPVRAT